MPRKTFETNEQAYNAVYNAFLEHSRCKHSFPKVHDVEKSLGIHMRNYGIKPRKIKVRVLKQRLGEIYNQDPSIGEKRINKLLGMGVSGYLKDLGVETLSELRKSYVGKESKRGNRKKFDTKEDAVRTFRSKTKEMVLSGEYKNIHGVEKKVGANVVTYGINWKGEILYPIYRELIAEEFELNPNLGNEEINQKYSFAQSLIESQGGLVIFKVKNKIPVSKNEEDTLLRGLVLEAVKVEKSISEENIWGFIKEKTDISFDTFRIPQEIENLKRERIIEGNKLVGYRKVG